MLFGKHDLEQVLRSHEEIKNPLHFVATNSGQETGATVPDYVKRSSFYLAELLQIYFLSDKSFLCFGIIGFLLRRILFGWLIGVIQNRGSLRNNLICLFKQSTGYFSFVCSDKCGELRKFVTYLYVE